MFKQPNYLENFVQATFNALTAQKVKGEIFSYSSWLLFKWMLVNLTVP